MLNSPLKGPNLLPEYNHPLFELPDPSESDEVEWLLVAPLLDKDFNRNSFELNDPLSWEGSLRSEPVKVRKTRVQHEMDEIDDGKYGAYAYWVGDEGVKTKVSVKNPNRNSTLSRIKKDNLMVATEPNIQFEFNGGLGESGYESVGIIRLLKNERMIFFQWIT